MKKFHSAILFAVAASCATAQTPIWSDDFSNASNWTMGHLGSATGDWTIGTTPPGGPPYNIDPIASTTAGNGFALYDSNVICAADSAYLQNATAIDLSAHPNVVLQFEEFYRAFYGHTYVQVSTNGSTWTTVQVNSMLDPTDFVKYNPTVIRLDLSATAGGQSTVWIRFLYGGNCDYAWMVDDVAILDQPDNDLVTLDAATTTWADFNTLTFDSLGYSIYPISEIRPLGLNMKVFNFGTQTASNATAHITTTDGYDESQNLGSIAPGDTVAYLAPSYMPPATVGTYMIYYDVDDGDPDSYVQDNSDTMRVQVSDYIYAVDKDALQDDYYDTPQGDAYKLGNVFYVNVDEILYGIDVAFAPTSEVGVEMNAQLLDPNTAEFDPIAETGYHSLVSSDLATMGGNHVVSFIFDTPVQLTAGTDYMPVVQHFGGADVRIGTSGKSPDHTSFIYSSSDADWFYVTNTPMVRMNFNPTVGIAENDFHNGIGLGQNYPNPANNGSTRIDFSLEQPAQVNLELHDVSGKLLQTLANGTMAPGVHHVNLNTIDLGTGVYFYTLTTDKAVATKRMTVVR